MFISACHPVAKMLYLKTRHILTFLRLYVTYNCNNCQWNPYSDCQLSFFHSNWPFDWWCFSGKLTSQGLYIIMSLWLIITATLLLNSVWATITYVPMYTNPLCSHLRKPPRQHFFVSYVFEWGKTKISKLCLSVLHLNNLFQIRNYKKMV